MPQENDSDFESQSAEFACQGLQLEFEELSQDENTMGGTYLTKDCILKILDFRFNLNGLKRLNQLYEQKKKQALDAENFDLYRQIYFEFQSALYERKLGCLKGICK